MKRILLSLATAALGLGLMAQPVLAQEHELGGIYYRDVKENQLQLEIQDDVVHFTQVFSYSPVRFTSLLDIEEVDEDVLQAHITEETPLLIQYPKNDFELAAILEDFEALQADAANLTELEQEFLAYLDEAITPMDDEAEIHVQMVYPEMMAFESLTEDEATQATGDLYLAMMEKTQLYQPDPIYVIFQRDGKEVAMTFQSHEYGHADNEVGNVMNFIKVSNAQILYREMMEESLREAQEQSMNESTENGESNESVDGESEE